MKIMQHDSSIQRGNTIKKNFELKVNPNTQPGMKDGFKSYNDYLLYLNLGDKRGKITLKKKLERLSDSLIIEYGYYIDPILYLAELYYGKDELSIDDIHKRVFPLGMNHKNNNSLEKTFKDTFGWVLRDASGGKNTRKKNKAINKIGVAKEKYDEIVEKKYETLKKYVSNNVYRILSLKNFKFNNNYFSGLNKTDKILYVLETFLGLKKDDIIEMNKLGPGAKIIEKYLNVRLQIYKKNYNFELVIFPKDIQKILNENKN